MTFSESVKEFGNFNFACMEMRRKRESYPVQQIKWLVPLAETVRGTGRLYSDERSKPATQPIAEPKKIVKAKHIVTVDAIPDDEVAQPSEDDTTEVCVAPEPLVAGQDDEQEQENEENQMNLEEGDGQSDATVSDDECTA
jgi:hypothetical protein